MLKYRHHFFWISILVFLPACNKTGERKNATTSENKTAPKVNRADSTSKNAMWIEGKDVQRYTGSTILGDLNNASDWDSTAIAKYEAENSYENSFQGSIPDSKLERFHYPLRSKSGGSVDGFYDSTELVRIESVFDAEFGYSAINVDFQNGAIEKINYRQYFPDYNKYARDFPDLKEIDPEKLTYTDTTYILEFGSIKSSKKYAGKKFVSTVVKEDMIEHLIECAKKMKSELGYERESVKK